MDNTINYRKIGKHLRDAREQNAMTQQIVAEKLGIQTDTYGNIERGVNHINLKHLVHLCVIFNIKPGFLLDDCTPELLLQDYPKNIGGTSSREELLKLLAHCSDDLIKTIYCIAKALYDDESLRI